MVGETVFRRAGVANTAMRIPPLVDMPVVVEAAKVIVVCPILVLGMFIAMLLAATVVHLFNIHFLYATVLADLAIALGF